MDAQADPTQLGRYELVAELASGGMATVYLARLRGVGGFQRFVAIKRLHPHLARDREFIEMFIDEARLAARIHHPNVVPILEIEMSTDGHYLVMEYIEGDTVGRLLAKSAQAGRRLPAAVGIRVVLDALAGLHAAHELKDDDGKPLSIVHRDVSPQNVLVGVDGVARITDFGVARAATRLSETRTGQLKGKLAYMAPEQARTATARQVDRRADLFAVGVVLWEVLACKRLFKGEGDADTLHKLLHEPIPSLKSVLPTIPAVLDAVVSKALERDRDKRFTSAAEFSDALEKAARAGGVIGSPREVAAHVDAVLGTDISQQRDAVRAWIARSEPSLHPRAADERSHPREVARDRVGLPSDAPPRPEDADRVSTERARTSEPTRPEAPAPRAAAESGLGGAGDVSSVSAAALSVARAGQLATPSATPLAMQAGATDAPPAPRRRSGRGWLALALVVGVAVGVPVARLVRTNIAPTGPGPVPAGSPAPAGEWAGPAHPAESVAEDEPVQRPGGQEPGAQESAAQESAAQTSDRAALDVAPGVSRDAPSNGPASGSALEARGGAENTAGPAEHRSGAPSPAQSGDAPATRGQPASGRADVARATDAASARNATRASVRSTGPTRGAKPAGDSSGSRGQDAVTTPEPDTTPALPEDIVHNPYR